MHSIWLQECFIFRPTYKNYIYSNISFNPFKIHKRLITHTFSTITPMQLRLSRDLRVINHAVVRIVSKTHFFPAVVAQKLLHSCSVLETASRTSLRLLSSLHSIFCDDSEKSKINNRNSVWMSFLLVVMFFTSLAHWLLHIRKLHVVIRLLQRAG